MSARGSGDGDGPAVVDEVLTDEDKTHLRRIADSNLPFAEDAEKILEEA